MRGSAAAVPPTPKESVPMTLRDTLEQSAGRLGDKTLLRYKRNGEWNEMGYAEFLAKVRNASELLVGICKVRPGDRVALMGANSPEWCVAHYGITSIGAIAVPTDSKLREQEIAHVLSDSGAIVLIADIKFYSTIKDLESSCPALRHVVLIDNRDAPIDFGRQRHVKYHDFNKLMEATASAAAGPSAAYDRYRPADTDIAAFLYTSGTTGRQKGAMLTHGNFTSNFESLRDAIEIRPDDNFLLILPLHHAFAFTTTLVTPIAAGIEISFVESLRTISENIRETHPSILLAVPLLLEKIRDKILANIHSNKIASSMWRLGIRGPIRKQIAENFGGRIRLIVSGGAPIDSQILHQLEDFGLRAREGYGLTECAPVLTLNPYDQPFRPRSCGKVLPHVEMTVLDPNEEGVGLLAAKGGNIMKGYYNNNAATAETFRDGWFLTGDLGYIDDDNFVFITGRKKSLIVNREGKNIYPEEVENQINRSPFILECVVLGYHEPGEPVGEHVGIIVAPNEEAIAAHEKATRKKLSEDEIRDLLRAEVRKQAQERAEFKRPRRIQVRWEEFNKTSTGKIKRYLYAMNETSL